MPLDRARAFGTSDTLAGVLHTACDLIQHHAPRSSEADRCITILRRLARELSPCPSYRPTAASTPSKPR